MKNKKEKKFDCVKMMRDIRDKINSEISNLTTEQLLEYLQKGHNDFKKEIEKSI